MNEKPDLTDVPSLPGCYIFRNKRRDIIYIGKSKSLNNRVRQYFYENNSPEYNKYASMASMVNEIETIVTDTETNALILEYRLIKKHKPKYNSKLKNTKLYPFIRVDTTLAYPTITIADNVLKDGSFYCGSFYNREDAQSVIDLISSIWQTPSCNRPDFSGTKRPCLNHHIAKCCAPCTAAIEVQRYNEKISDIIRCLGGSFKNTLDRLNREMAAAAGAFDFEKAAGLRDKVSALRRLKKRQKQFVTDLAGKDVYLFLRAFNEPCFSLFYISNGVTLNRMDFPALDEPAPERLESYVRACRAQSEAFEEGAFMTSCLLDIGASKFFIPISSKVSLPQAVKKLQKAFKEFIS